VVRGGSIRADGGVAFLHEPFEAAGCGERLETVHASFPLSLVHRKAPDQIKWVAL